MNMSTLGGQIAKTFQAQRIAQTKAQRPRRTWHVYGSGGNSVRRLLGAWERAVGRETRQITEGPMRRAREWVPSCKKTS